MQPLPIAAGGIEEILVWLVIAAFYLIIQKLGGKKRQRQVRAPMTRTHRPAPAAPPPPEPTIEDQLREFLETLGQPAEILEPPAPPPIQPEPPRIRPKRRMEPAVPAAVEEAAGHPPRKTTQSPIQVEPLGQFTSSLMSTQSLQVGLAGLRMPLMRVPLGLSPSRQAIPYRLNLQDKRTLKHAILNHFILGPPRAVQEDWHRF